MLVDNFIIDNADILANILDWSGIGIIAWSLKQMAIKGSNIPLAFSKM